MSLKVLDRVQEQTTSQGAGALTLGGATLRMLGFVDAGFADGDTFYGLIEHTDAVHAEWEISVCTFHVAGNITRATPLKSSTGAAVAFSAGIKLISLVLPAAEISVGLIGPLRPIDTNTYNIQMLATDYEVGLNNPISLASDVTLPLFPTAGQWAVVSDLKGDAGTYPITIHGPMNGGTSMVINANFGWAVYRYSGAQWINRGIVG